MKLVQAAIQALALARIRSTRVSRGASESSSARLAAMRRFQASEATG
jgi:hypothetical protein